MAKYNINTRREIWNKASHLDGYDQNEYRVDSLGNTIRWENYGDTSHHYGWEIDHITPLNKGGLDTFDNWQALYWKANREKSDKNPFAWFFKLFK